MASPTDVGRHNLTNRPRIPSLSGMLWLRSFEPLLYALPLIILASTLVSFPASLQVVQPGDVHFYFARGMELLARGIPSWGFTQTSGGFTNGFPLAYPPFLPLLLALLRAAAGFGAAHALFLGLQYVLFFGGPWLVSYKLDGGLAACITGFLLLFALPSTGFVLSIFSFTWLVLLIPLLFFAVLSRNRALVSTLLCAAAYAHASGGALFASVALYWIANPRERRWVLTPLVFAGVASLPVAALIASQSGFIHPFGDYWVPLAPTALIPVSLAFVSLLVWKADERNQLAACLLIPLSLVFGLWAGGGQFSRLVFAATPLLAITGARMAGMVAPSRKWAFALLLAVVGLAFLSQPASVPYSVPFQAVQLHAASEPFASSGRETEGLSDARRAIQAFSPPDEVLITNVREAPMLGWLTGLRVSKYVPEEFAPCQFDRAKFDSLSRAAFYRNPDSVPSWFCNSTVVYNGPAGTLFIGNQT